MRAESVCELGNMDIFLIAGDNTFAMLGLLLNSIARFIPCSRRINLLIDRGYSMRKIKLWIAPFYNPHNHVVRIYPFEFPTSVPFITNFPNNKKAGYILQAWVMMWADKYSLDEKIDGLSFPGNGRYSFWLSQDTIQRFHSGEVNHIMFLDTDALFVLPVTCGSLFDAEGRFWLPSWTMNAQNYFRNPCITMTGLPCDHSFMAFFPFVFPVDGFAPVREFVRDNIVKSSPAIKTSSVNISSFDAVFDYWSSTHADWHLFSQFIVMGEVYRHLFPKDVKELFCFSSSMVNAVPSISDLPNVSNPSLLSLLASPDIVELYPASSLASRSIRENWSSEQLGKYYIPPAMHYAWPYQEFINAKHLYYHDALYWRAYDAQSWYWGNQNSMKFGVRPISMLSGLVHNGECLRYSLARQLECQQHNLKDCNDSSAYINTEYECTVAATSSIPDLLNFFADKRPYDMSLYVATYSRAVKPMSNKSLSLCSRRRTTFSS